MISSGSFDPTISVGNVELNSITRTSPYTSQLTLSVTGGATLSLSSLSLRQSVLDVSSGSNVDIANNVTVNGLNVTDSSVLNVGGDLFVTGRLEDASTSEWSSLIAGSGTQVNVTGKAMFGDGERQNLTTIVRDGAIILSDSGGITITEDYEGVMTATHNFTISGAATRWDITNELYIGSAPIEEFEIEDERSEGRTTNVLIEDGAQISSATSNVSRLEFSDPSNAGIESWNQTETDISQTSSVIVDGANSRWTTSGIVTLGNLGSTTQATEVDLSGLTNPSLEVNSQNTVDVEVRNGARIDSGELQAGAMGQFTYDTQGLIDNDASLDLDVSSNVEVAIHGAGSIWANSGNALLGSKGDVNLSVTTPDFTYTNDVNVAFQVYNAGTFANGGSITLANDEDTSASLIVGGKQGDAALAPGRIEASQIIFGGGNGRLVLNHTSLEHGFDNDIAGGLSGEGTIIQENGRSILAQNSSAFTGTTEISGGSLQVNGELGGEARILGGGTLEGNGTLDTVTNSGRISPGSGTNRTHGQLNSFGTLTISNNYIGADGTLAIDAALAGDGSSTDLLFVQGDTSGNTFVRVTNRNGAGAQTIDGIKVVDVTGTSNGTFNLQGDYVHNGAEAVVGGAYAYKLSKNGLSTPNDGDWYLRSELDDNGSDGEDNSLYQAGVPTYEAYPQALLSLNKLSTLIQRVGNRLWIGNGAPEAYTTQKLVEGNGMWGRIDGSRSSITPDYSTSSTEFTQTAYMLQTGLDFQLSDEDGGVLIGGVFVHYTHGQTKTKSGHGDGEISTDGFGIGSTLTWYGDSGFYVDGQAQATWYSSDLSSRLDDIGFVSGNDAFGYALGVEVGQKFNLDGNWSITPQAQLSYSNVAFDSFVDTFDAMVKHERGESLEARLGMTLDYDAVWQNDKGTTDRAKFYGIANVYYDLLGDTRISVEETKFKSEKDRLRGGIGIGGSYNWDNDKYSIYGETLLTTSLNNFGESNDLQFKVGLRVNW